VARSVVYGRRAELKYQSRNESRGLLIGSHGSTDHSSTVAGSKVWCWKAGCNMAPGRSEKGMCCVYICVCAYKYWCC